MVHDLEWGLARRIVFRFAFVFGALLVFPFPLDMIPPAGPLVAVLMKPLTWSVVWFVDVLGLPQPVPGPNGSGDRAFDYAGTLLFVIAAAIAAIVWSVIDRRRRAYPRLATAAWIVLRYYVAAVMFSYGVSKVLKLQFYDLSPGVLHQRIGDTPPMRLMWAFMGYSQPYTVFSGLAEVIGGALLLWRRTVMLGALLVIAVMTNVVMLNLCYDVPVKLFSTQLLVMTLLIALPGAKRLFGAALGRAVAELPPRPRGSSRRERARLIVKLVFVASLGYWICVPYAKRPSHDDHRHELYGNWIVDRFVRDGVEHPPLTTDPVRWESWSASPAYMQIWRMNGTFEGRTDYERGWYDINVDPTAKTITVVIDDKQKTKEVWTYVRPAPDQLVIDGVHRGATLHLALHREPDGVLVTRGFHWYNEMPFNR